MDVFTIVAVFVAFLSGGVVKGILGLGLPLTAVALMSTVLDLRLAIPLLVIPITVTNIWQAVRGGRMKALLARYWPMLLASCIGVWIGTAALYRIDPAFLLATLGIVVCAYALINLLAVELTLTPAAMPVLSPLVGLFSGVLSGSTGSLGVPVVIYLQALGLAKDVFIQAIGLQFLITGSVWIVALVEQGGLTAANLPVSAAALVPALAGMVVGQWMRARLSQERFRTWLFVFLVVIGINLIRKGLF